MARKLSIHANLQPPRRRAGRDDQRLGRDRRAIGKRDRERPAFEIDARDVALHDLGAEALGLRAHLRHQVRAHDAVAEPGPVLDHRRQHQLPAGLEAFDEQRLQVGARGVERRRQAGGPGSDDDDFAIGHA